MRELGMRGLRPAILLARLSAPLCTTLAVPLFVVVVLVIASAVSGFSIGLLVGGTRSTEAYHGDYASNYSLLADELRLCREEVSKFAEEKKACEADLLKLAEELNASSRELGYLREENLNLKVMLRDKQDAIDTLVAENEALRSRIENLTEENLALRREIDACRALCVSREEEAGEEPVYRIVIQYVMYDPPGTEPDNEYIILYNPNDFDVNISGWYITDGEGTYVFPPGTVIKARSTLQIYGREYNPTRNRRGLWLNNEDDHVALYNDRDELIDCKGWGDEKC